MTDTAVEVQGGVFEQALRICDGRERADLMTVERIAQLIGKLRDTGDCSRYLQGGCLSYLYDQERWRIYQDVTFREFCPQMLGISYRHGMYLIELFRRAQTLGLTPARLQQLGWTKARNIVQVATSETLEDWLSRAESMTTVQVEHAVQKARKARRTDMEEEDASQLLEDFHLRLTHEQRENVEACIEEVAKSGAERGLLSRGEALDLIVTDFRANWISSPEQALEWHLAQLQRVYGVRLLVVTDVQSEVSAEAH